MILTNLIYFSAHRCQESDMEDILNVARKNNAAHNITGIMLFTRKYFLQYIEGSRANINQLYNNIVRDKRHDNCVLVTYQHPKLRVFPEFSMGFLAETQDIKKIILEHSSSSEFDPLAFYGESMIDFIKQLSLLGKIK